MQLTLICHFVSGGKVLVKINKTIFSLRFQVFSLLLGSCSNSESLIMSDVEATAGLKSCRLAGNNHITHHLGLCFCVFVCTRERERKLQAPLLYTRTCCACIIMYLLYHSPLSVSMPPHLELFVSFHPLSVSYFITPLCLLPYGSHLKPKQMLPNQINSSL